MLVIPAAGDPALVAPRLEATPARACPPAAAGDLPVVTWEEGRRRPRARRRDGPRRARRAARPPRSGRRLGRPPGAPPAPPPGPPRPSARLELASPILRELRIVKDADEIALLTEAAHAADRVVAQIAGGRLVGRTEADVAREVRERLIAEGHDEAAFRDRRLRARIRPRRTTRRPSGSSRPASRSCSTSAASIGGYGSDITRTLWVTGGDPANGPGRAVPPPVRASCAAPRRPRRGRSGRASRPRRSMPPRATRSRPRATARRSSTGPGTGSASRATRTRTSSPATASRSGRGWPSRSSPGSTSSDEYGARIEDIVVCGPDGPIALNEAPRDLYVVDG